LFGRLDALESKVEEQEGRAEELFRVASGLFRDLAERVHENERASDDRIDDLNRQVTILRLQLASLAHNAEARIQATERCIRDAISIN
jgi:hypothetical protein